MITDTITEEARDLIRQMQGEIEKLHDQLDDTNAMVSALNGDVHNIGQERDKLREQLVRATDALKEVDGCFQAAYAEGLSERLAESDQSHETTLASLFFRRVVFAHHAAINALTDEQGK